MENRKKVLMIINPTAGKQTFKGHLFSIIEGLCKNNCIPTVLTTSAKGDATKYASALVAEHDIIICAGGDGTLNETITGMLNRGCFCPIGYIPCGTTNDMANSLKLPKTVRKAAAVLSDNNPCYHDIGRFGDMGYFSYIASFGAFTKVSYTTPQSAKNVLGHFAYVLNGAAELGNIKSYRVKVILSDRVIEEDCIYLSVTNTKSFAGLFSFPEMEVSLNDGEFEILLIKTPKNVIDVSTIVHNISTKNFSDEKYMLLLRSNKVTVETEENIIWTIDGESSPEINKVDIEVIPNKIQIYLPKQE